MREEFWILLLLCVAALLLLLVIRCRKRTTTPVLSTLEDDTLALELPLHPGSGVWQLTENDDAILEVCDRGILVPEGADERWEEGDPPFAAHLFTVHALSAGSVRLKFVFQPAEDSGAFSGSALYTVTVDKSQNVRAELQRYDDPFAVGSKR